MLAACAFEGFEPEVAFGVDVAEVYIHCAKALRRSKLWDPTTWPEPDARPHPAQIIKDHVKIDVPTDAIEADLEKNYVETIWAPGGDDRPLPNPAEALGTRRARPARGPAPPPRRWGRFRSRRPPGAGVGQTPMPKPEHTGLKLATLAPSSLSTFCWAGQS